MAGTEEDGEGEGAFPRVTHLFPEVEVEVDRISDDDDREGRPPARPLAYPRLPLLAHANINSSC